MLVVALFFVKNKTSFKNEGVINQQGLAYSNLTLQDLVNKDTAGDGIPDWKKRLLGIDPSKKISDSEILNNFGTGNLNNQTGQSSDQNLTQTDKFSRELFGTVATLSQSETMDQATIDSLSASLADKIKNPVIRKIFSTSNLKIINNDSIQAFIDYSNTLGDIYGEYTIKYSVLDVFQQFGADENNIDESALLKLDPIITQMNQKIQGMLKMSVPQSIATLHLGVINTLQKLVENISDVKLYSTDPVIALGGISKYDENVTGLDSTFNSLMGMIKQKLNK